ncbi:MULTISPECIES: YtzI protein [Bacillaceae]|nr:MULTISPECIES: YtzI protein [Bacillaceae]
MTTIIIISVIIVLIILVLSVLTINKGYDHKHTIDPPASEKQEETRETK